jgi:hypothetical protein
MGKRPGYRHRHIDVMWTDPQGRWCWYCQRCGESRPHDLSSTRAFVDAEKAFVRAHRHCVLQQGRKK